MMRSYKGRYVTAIGVVLLLMTSQLMMAGAGEAGPPPNPEKFLAPANGAEAKLSPAVRAVVRKAKEGVKPATLSNHYVRMNEAGELQVYVCLNRLEAGLVKDFQALGARVELTNEDVNMVQAWIPFFALGGVAELDAVKEITLPDYPRTRAGSVTSEGDLVMGSELVRDAYPDVDGSGITVGVISDGVDNLAAARASDDLPDGGALVDGARAGSGDHGTALLEIIHDVAPAAQLAFSGPSTSLEFIASVNWMVNSANCDIIMDNLGFYEEPYFQDGLVAQRVATAAENVLYISAAGNDGLSHYQAAYKDYTPGATGWGNDYHDFGPTGTPDHDLDVTIPPGGTIACFLQWTDPFGASANDYNLYMFNSDLTALMAGSNAVQNGDDNPYEAFTYTNTSTSAVRGRIIIDKLSGDPRVLELFVWDAASLQYNTPSDAIFGHPCAPKVLSVAAINATDPGLNTVAPYSSRGPATIMYPDEVTRNVPRVACFDRVTVSGAGDIQVPMVGTSAAAAHAAGAAALIMDFRNAANDPEMVRNLIETNAVDIGPAGFDTASGFGRIDLTRIIELPPIRGLIYSFYRRILDRTPEPGAVDAWEDGFIAPALDLNLNIAIVIKEIARSFFFGPEYAARGRNDQQFLFDCYYALLGRAPSQAEVDGWLAGEWDREVAFSLFVNSAEFEQRMLALFPGEDGESTRNFVAIMYSGLLKRLVDPAGLTAYANQFNANPDKRAQSIKTAQEIVAAPEFDEPPLPEKVRRLYVAFLDRLPSEAETNAWVNAINNFGMTLNDAIVEFAGSAEFSARLQEYFPGWE